MIAARRGVSNAIKSAAKETHEYNRKRYNKNETYLKYYQPDPVQFSSKPLKQIMSSPLPIAKYTFSNAVQRLWNSPTFNTWGSYATQSFNLVLVLPLLLTRFSTAEIAVWYLFKTILDLQFVVDLGFSVTLSRFIAYLSDTSRSFQGLSSEQNLPRFKNKEIAVSQIWETMNIGYLALSLIATLLIGLSITFILARPISFVENPNIAWSSWGVVIITLFVSINGLKYTALLQGINAIAEYRRWETLTNSGAIFTSFIVLLFHGNILALVTAQQVWKILNVLVNRELVRRRQDTLIKSFDSLRFHREVFTAIWPASWRSGLGLFMSYGVTQISGLIYAQYGTAANIATYLLGLRLLQQVSTFARAPFYSKLPTIFRLYSEGKINRMLETAKRGMALAYWTYGILFFGLAFSAGTMLQIIKSNATFVPATMWGLLGLGFLFERFGAHHIQLYSATNEILWHIANGVTGVFFIFISIVAFPWFGVYSFPIAFIAGYAGFYSWYSGVHSYRAFRMQFWEFEPLSLWVVLSFMLVYLVASLF